MYDLDNDDMISQEELIAVLHMMVGSTVPAEQVSQSYYEEKINNIRINYPQKEYFFPNKYIHTYIFMYIYIHFYNR